MAELLGQKQLHMDTLRRLITPGRISDTLLFDFTTITFASREGAIGAAQTFEDLGVMAINGLGGAVTNVNDIMLIGKIASVWARHAATIRDLRYTSGLHATRASFAGDDVVDPTTGLEAAIDAPTFVTTAQPYFVTTLSLT